MRGKQAAQGETGCLQFVSWRSGVTGESFAVFPVYVFYPCSPLYIGKTGLAIGWACLPPRQGWGRSSDEIKLEFAGRNLRSGRMYRDSGGSFSKRVGTAVPGDKKREARRGGERPESLGAKGWSVMSAECGWLGRWRRCCVPCRRRRTPESLFERPGGLSALQVLCSFPTTALWLARWMAHSDKFSW